MKPVFILAEVGQTHEGSLNQCYAFVDAVATTGANAIKFQKHIADAESSVEEQWRIKFSKQDERRIDYWRRMQFSKEQWIGLKTYAESKGLVFISSPFSEEATDWLVDMKVEAWKIGSGEVLSYRMLDKIVATKKHLYISSGMSPWAEMDEYVGYLKDKNASFTLMQCTTEYPVDPKNVGLNVMHEMKERYGCPVGLSDHSGTIYPSLAAVAQGASAIEVHVTLSKHMFGPDVPSSVDIDELKELVKGVRMMECMLANPVHKDEMAEQKDNLRRIFFKGATAKEDIEAGQKITDFQVEFRKPPGDGLRELEWSFYKEYPLVKSIRKGEKLTKEYFSSDVQKKVSQLIQEKRAYFAQKAIEISDSEKKMFCSKSESKIIYA